MNASSWRRRPPYGTFTRPAPRRMSRAEAAWRGWKKAFIGGRPWQIFGAARGKKSDVLIRMDANCIRVRRMILD
jgi:hypothetical protein